MTASSNSFPATLTAVSYATPASEMTATSVVPLPTSTIILPAGSPTCSPAPTAAASDSFTKRTERAPAR